MVNFTYDKEKQVLHISETLSPENGMMLNIGINDLFSSKCIPTDQGFKIDIDNRHPFEYDVKDPAVAVIDYELFISKLKDEHEAGKEKENIPEFDKTKYYTLLQLDNNVCLLIYEGGVQNLTGSSLVKISVNSQNHLQITYDYNHSFIHIRIKCDHASHLKLLMAELLKDHSSHIKDYHKELIDIAIANYVKEPKDLEPQQHAGNGGFMVLGAGGPGGPIPW